MTDEKNKKSETKGWEDLIFGTFEKIAQAPNRLKDPKETMNFAFDWVKGMRGEVQERVKEEISARIGKLDFNQIAKRVADHLADNYQVKISATLSWEPKEGREPKRSMEDLNVDIHKVKKEKQEASEPS